MSETTPTEQQSFVRRFRKKPVVIEAAQLTIENFEDVRRWCGGTTWSRPPMRAVTGISIATLEGKMDAEFGDVIIKGVKGEFYPCKPDIFDRTYDDANTPDPRIAALEQQVATLTRERDDANAEAEAFRSAQADNECYAAQCIDARDAAIAREAGLREALSEAKAFVEGHATRPPAGHHCGDPDAMCDMECSVAAADAKLLMQISKALSTPGPTLASIRAETAREAALLALGDSGSDHIYRRLLAHADTIEAATTKAELGEHPAKAAFDKIIEPIRETARTLGYAIAVHGSLARDIDLIAVPWTSTAVDAKELAEAVRATLDRVTGYAKPSPRETQRHFQEGCITGKSHGRRVWSIHLHDDGSLYVDLSVMPRGNWLECGI